ncbi:MAG: amidohydrolase family protein [Acidimicrobiales bacterium]
MPEGDPEHILADMDRRCRRAGDAPEPLCCSGSTRRPRAVDGPRRAYNDYVIERFSPHFDRLAPTAPVPITDIDDAVAEIERVAAAGFRAILLPACPRSPTTPCDFDPVWEAAQANGCTCSSTPRPVASRSTTRRPPRSRGGDGVGGPGQPADDGTVGVEADDHLRHAPIVPQQVLCELIGGGVAERYPDLHFALIEFNANWLSSLVSDGQVLDHRIGQDADWWLGHWDDTRPAHDQPNMAQLFRLKTSGPTR